MKCFNWTATTQPVNRLGEPNMGYKTVATKTHIDAFNMKGLNVSGCCGSLIADLQGKKYPFTLRYEYPKSVADPVKKAAMNMGVFVWLGAQGIIPDSGEDSENVYSSVLIDGEKVIFQFRKCD